MKKIVTILMSLLSMTLSMSAAKDGKFSYSYPPVSELPYNLGYQFSTYDLKESEIEGWKVMELNEPLTLAYNITSEEEKTVEVVFDPSYMEILDIVIPEKVIDPDTNAEYTVTAIGKMAFDDCPEIRSVIMPNSITRIEDYAFNMCENKKLHHIGYIKFSQNLTHIGNYAFKNCHNLTTGHYTEGDQWPLTVADFVRNVDYPFYGYGGRQSGLENYLLLPASVNHIGEHAFEGCYFEDIIAGKESNVSRVYGLSKVKIPNPSCYIGDYAFAGCRFLELITIGEELTSNGLMNPTPETGEKGHIGNYAFANCNLMRLDIPSSIKSIGDYAFINCFNRSRDHTPRVNEGRIYLDNLKWFYPRSLYDNYDSWWANWNNGSAPEDRIIKSNAYLDRWHTNTVIIHGDNTKVGTNAFANNPHLEKVIINGSTGDILEGTFRNCTKLATVEFPAGLTEISRSMFMNCSALNSITIPENVTEIGDSAFYECEKLVTIELPSNLTKVNPYTFFGCIELSLSTLPGEVSSIGNHAFFGCKEITTLTIPDKVTTIGEYAFADCYRHGYKLNPDHGKGLSSDPYIYLFGLTKVKIGEGVQTIGAHAFDGCRHLGTIEMGKNVREIGDYAFQNCMSCPEDGCTAANNALTLPKSLTKMGTGAFQGCKNLPGITLGEDMTELPDFAFAYCSNLSSIGNIDNIKSTKDNTFLGCYSLEGFGELYADKENLEDGIIYNDNYTEVISALPNITEAKLRETVTKICDGAFANCGALQSVSFPETLEEIGSCAFSNCGALQNLVFPNSLKEIGSRAFENCTALQSADLINVKMGEFVYAGCTGIFTVFIAQDFTQDLLDNWFAGCIKMSAIAVIGDNARYSSYEDQLLLNKEEDTLLRAPSGIDYLGFPDTVTTIGDYACSNCINLSELEIPATVTHIGAHAFDGCYYEEVDDKGKPNSWGLKNVYINNPAVTIGEYAFNNCKLLAEIYWDGEAEPDAMGSIGAFAFNNCEELIFAPEDLTNAAIDSIKPYAFANFPGIEDIELPETLVNIGDHAFENCQNLKSVVFPESLKSIGNSAFKSSGLTYLDLPDTIEEIGDSAFMDCSKVMALKLPSGLKKIKPYTFYKCFSGGQFDEQPEENFNLSIEIPESVESIGDYAFYGCDSNSNKYHKDETGQSYSNYYYYYIYGIRSVTIGENVQTIGAHAFDGCTHLLEVDMGNAVTSIGDYAFNDCFNQYFNGVRKVEVLLYGSYEKDISEYPKVWEMDSIISKDISLPESLESLGEGAFNGCKELPDINIPASLTSISAQAFNGCESLKKIELQEGIESIGDGAFGGCKGVTEIHIPASLIIGSRAFVDCEKAIDVYYYAEKPEVFDEAFFSPKVYSSKESVVHTPNALLADVKGLTPWALFYKIEAKDETLEHLERVLEEKNGLRFRVLSNKPTPYCEVAGPAEIATEPTSYVVPEFVVNNDEASEYFGQEYKVIRIGNDAFENDLTLVGIEIPESVYDIGLEAFNGCKNLPEINLPNSITTMGERAFANCYGLTYFKIPPKVTRLNTEVLKDCRGLYSIKMHENITELGVGSLMDCRHLRQFEQADNWKLQLIDDYALKNCIELEDIYIPEGVLKIGKEAMYYCQKLNTVSLPKTLRQLGENTFDDCEVLQTIKVYTETPPETVGQRNLTDQNCKIYVQAKCFDAYKKFWPVHEHRILPGISVTQPTRAQMPEYSPGNIHKIDYSIPVEFAKQYITGWTSSNSVVATPHADNDGKMMINGVGRTHIHVDTYQNFYHDCDIEVYPQLADANWDGRFDISDAVNIANYAIENETVLTNWNDIAKRSLKNRSDWTDFYKVGADVNKDGYISVSDASAAVKIALNQNPAKSSAPARRIRSIDALDNRDALLLYAPEGNTVKVGLDNSNEYVALQAFVRVPEGMTLKNVTAGNRAAAHTLTSRRIDDRTMRVILFDFNNSAFARSGESLFEIEATGDMTQADDIEIFEIIASDISSCSHDLTLREGGIYTSVHAVSDADRFIKASEDGLIISGAEGLHVAIYSLDGYAIRSFDAGANSEFISLPHGIYIVNVGDNSSKIVVK